MNETNIEIQLEKISRQLDRLSNPLKVAWLQMVSGFFHALGNIIFIILITFASIYIFSAFNLDKVFTDYIQSLIPKPQINIQSPFQ